MPSSRPEQAVVYTQTVEGLIRALGTKLDARVSQKFADLGLTLTGKLQAAYPRKVWIPACIYAGEVLFPGVAPEVQRRQLGHRFIDGYNETMSGKALLTILRVLGPRRALTRIEQNLRTGNNYAVAKLVDTNDGPELHMTDVPYPEWYLGMIEKALQMTGAKDVAVSMKVGGDNTAVYRIGYR